MKKIVALLLICCMVLPMISASAAATEEPTPTIEEIFKEYHAKAFEARAAAENGGASTYARGGSSQTLEQETVDILTDAGYEAYNVTGDNYDSVEETLNTDLASLGLDPNCSYVVVISGEEPEAQSNPNSRVILPPSQEDFGDDNGGGGNLFYYTQDGTTYTMRYVTLTSATESELESSFSCSLTQIDNMSSYNGDAFYALARLSVDSVTLKLPNSPEISFLHQWTNNEAYVVTNRAQFKLETKTEWTRSYIQVWDSNDEVWKTAQCSSYAYSYARATGNVKHRTNNSTVQIDTEKQYFTTYSPYYNYPATRKARAVQGFDIGTKMHDYVGNVGFYFLDADGVSITNDGSPLIIHEESLAYLLPIVQEE